MQNTYFHDVKEFQKSWNPDRSSRIEQQRRQLNQIYQHELNQQTHSKRFLDEMTEANGRPSLTRFRPGQYTELRQTLSRLHSRQEKFDRLFDRIEELLKEYDSVAPVTRLAGPPAMTSTSHIVSPIIVELDQEELSDGDE